MERKGLLQQSLYGIVGWFTMPRLARFAFGGYFRHGDLDNILTDGQLIDAFGPSIIKGSMDAESMTFDKTYTDTHNVVHYQFRREGDFWVGTYEGNASGSGRAECMTMMNSNEGFLIACGAPARYGIVNWDTDPFR